MERLGMCLRYRALQSETKKNAKAREQIRTKFPQIHSKQKTTTSKEETYTYSYIQKHAWNETFTRAKVNEWSFGIGDGAKAKIHTCSF